jgi:hypothetical protein
MKLGWLRDYTRSSTCSVDASAMMPSCDQSIARTQLGQHFSCVTSDISDGGIVQREVLAVRVCSFWVVVEGKLKAKFQKGSEHFCTPRVMLVQPHDSGIHSRGSWYTARYVDLAQNA